MSDLPDQALIDRALAALGDGPLGEDDLVRALGLDPDTAWDTEEELYLLDDDLRIVELLDGRLASGPALVDGVTVWHRVSPEEAEDRVIVLGPDLTVPAACGATSDEIRIGDDAVPVGDPVPTLGLSPTVELPDGWCPDLADGDLVSLTVAWPVDEEVATLTLVGPPDDPPTPDDAAAARLLAAIGATADEHGEAVPVVDGDEGGAWVADLDGLLPTAIAADPTALRDLGRPLAEVLEGAGMGLAGGVLGGPAVSIEHLLIYAVGLRISGVTAWASATAVGGTWLGISSGRPDTARTVLRMFTDPDVCDTIVSHVRNEGAPKAADIVTVLEDLEDGEELDGLGDGPAGGTGPRWLMAEALIADGRVLDAQEVLARTVGDRLPLVDAEEWVGPVERYAQGRAFAGDLDGAITAYRAIGENRIVELLGHWRSVPPADVGRNDPCPCGSGRKFKRCCMLAPPERPLADRSQLVWWKAMTICLDDHGDCLPDPRWLVGSGLPVALAIDTHLVEDGALHEVIDRWGPLLPDDEVDLLRTWVDTPRRVWEVRPTGTADRPGTEVELRDVATDERVRVPDEDVADGDGLSVGVVVDVDGTHRAMGEPVRVPPEVGDDLAAGLARATDGAEVLGLVAEVMPPEWADSEAEAAIQEALAGHLLADDAT